MTVPKKPAVPSSVHRCTRPGTAPPGIHSPGGSWSRVRAPRKISKSARCPSRAAAAGKTLEKPTPPPTSHHERSSPGNSKPCPSGSVRARGSPACSPDRRAVPRPTTLYTNSTVPFPRTPPERKIARGRGSSGSFPGHPETIANWPGTKSIRSGIATSIR
ncbi:MAG TPA: hypothetical protein VF325_00795 [Candidatus Deferrimicrobium sp.]